MESARVNGWTADFGTVPNSAPNEPTLIPQADLDDIAQRLKDEAKWDGTTLPEEDEEEAQPLQRVAEVKPGETTRDAAARLTGFGTGETYRRAKTVVEHGTPELVAAMDAGHEARTLRTGIPKM